MRSEQILYQFHQKLADGESIAVKKLQTFTKSLKQFRYSQLQIDNLIYQLIILIYQFELTSIFSVLNKNTQNTQKHSKTLQLPMQQNQAPKPQENDFSSDSDSENLFSDSSQFILNLHTTNIINVWSYNFQLEIKKLMELTQLYSVIAIDTEFPGICVNPRNDDGDLSSNHEKRRISTPQKFNFQYQQVRANIQATKLIQVGITISDENGNVPSPNFCWQFNLKFDRSQQLINPQSQALLQKAGIDFFKLKKSGISYEVFAEFMFASGMILNKKNKWVVFHGCHDLAYLLRLLTGQRLPEKLDQFQKLLQKHFPTVVDLKEVIQQVPKLKDVGLNKLAVQTKCQRIGSKHQAGSDSLLTLACYFSMNFTQETSNAMNKYFGGKKHVRNGVFGFSSREKTKSLNHQASKSTRSTNSRYEQAQTVNYPNYYLSSAQNYLHYHTQYRNQMNGKIASYENYPYWQYNYSQNYACQNYCQILGQKQNQYYASHFYQSFYPSVYPSQNSYGYTSDETQ